MLYETHMHTPLCRHARGEVEEYAAAAEQRGLHGIIVTCHNPFPDRYAQGSRMYLEQFPDYLAMVDRAAAAFAGRVDVRLGLECDWYPGAEEWLRRQIASADFHYILGSVHPQIEEYRRQYHTGDEVAYQKTYFDHLAAAAETGLFDCLSHPDLIKNITRPWQPQRIMGDIRRALDRIAGAGVAMELNTSGLHKTIPEMNPFPAMLAEMWRRDIPVVIGADAHVPHRVGANFDTALDLLEEAGYRQISIFLDRRRQEIDIDTARALLEPQRREDTKTATK